MGIFDNMIKGVSNLISDPEATIKFGSELVEIVKIALSDGVLTDKELKLVMQFARYIKEQNDEEDAGFELYDFQEYIEKEASKNNVKRVSKNNQTTSPSQPINAPMNAMPTIQEVKYYVAVNGQQAGPFDMNQLRMYVNAGQITMQTQVWRQGMASWDIAGNVAELRSLF